MRGMRVFILMAVACGSTAESYGAAAVVKAITDLFCLKHNVTPPQRLCIQATWPSWQEAEQAVRDYVAELQSLWGPTHQVDVTYADITQPNDPLKTCRATLRAGPHQKLQ
jgi:hypothetical protein